MKQNIWIHIFGIQSNEQEEIVNEMNQIKSKQI